MAKTASLDNLKEGQEQGNWFTRARRFIVDARSELSRVTWPTRREVWATTVVVILTSIFFGIYLWGIDLTLSYLQTRLFVWFGA